VIVIDPRTGSGELEPLFKSYGIDVIKDTLTFGDFAFSGNGPNGAVGVGIERKRMNDLVASIRDKRLSGYQLPGLLKTYDYVYLLIEGIFRVGKSGAIEIYVHKAWRNMIAGTRTVTYREIDHYVASLTHMCGVNVLYTGTKEQTVEQIISRYRWWNDKEWSKHGSFDQIYTHVPDPIGRSRLMRRTVSLVDKVAAQLFGVDKKAFELGKKFKTVKQLANATVSELEQVVGKKLASSIMKQINGGK
jgi:ERCC4-type nuclease